MEKGSISVYFVHSALEPVIARGLDAAPLLQEAGIAPSLLLSPHGRVSAQNFSALWLGVVRLLDDELFGQDTRRMKSGSFAMLTHALIACTTLEQALRRMARFFNLILDDFHCALECDADQARLTIGPAGARTPGAFGYETLLMMQHGLACWLIGRRIPIVAAAFCYPEPSRSAEYGRMYSEQLQFDAPRTALSFARSYLALPVIQNAATARDFLRGAPANIVLKYKNSSSLAAQIRRRLRTAARTEWPDFDTFARSLNMTASTLRRRLEDEGQSFQVIKDELRRDMAIDALSHSARSLAEIAGDLGFSEPSAFHRAFKKWTGAGPGAYRERILTDSASASARSRH
jgi:AraC-like DNA-binding protein